MDSKDMRLENPIFQTADVTEEVIIELIQSSPLQRLKGINTSGYPLPFGKNMTRDRYSHSIGVFMLLRQFGASLEEQIAGLIHDVSHSAFSHAIDYVLDEGSGAHQHHQDNVHDEFVRKSEIADIVRRHGFSLDRLLNDENFPLKETKLPDLCADRIDYSLNEALEYLSTPAETIQKLLDRLKVINRQWVYDNQPAARQHAEMFAELNTKHWSALTDAAVFYAVGQYLRHSLDNKYIDLHDLYTTDNAVLEKIAPHHNDDKKLALLWDRMNNKYRYVNDPDNYEAIVEVKSRAIDPLFDDRGSIRRLSDTDPKWMDFVSRELVPKKYFLRFLE
ncbi:MAG: HD domain-containing protein [bacterium]|nr:HD domain-containing protein [bacterium]